MSDEWRTQVINVQPGAFGKQCRVQGRNQKCGFPPRFMVFIHDGKPMSSRLDSCCCAKHLPHAVRCAKKDSVAEYRRTRMANANALIIEARKNMTRVKKEIAAEQAEATKKIVSKAP